LRRIQTWVKTNQVYRLDLKPQYCKEKETRTKTKERPYLKMFNIMGNEHKQDIIKLKSYLIQDKIK
jgi:hypothetical protein